MKKRTLNYIKAIISIIPVIIFIFFIITGFAWLLTLCIDFWKGLL